jgi:hypothetical protein
MPKIFSILPHFMDWQLSFIPEPLIDFLYYGSYVGIGVIPIFFNDKMMRKATKLRYGGRFSSFPLRKKISYVFWKPRKAGWIFLFCILFSTILTKVKASRDKQEDSIALAEKLNDQQKLFSVELNAKDEINRVRADARAHEAKLLDSIYDIKHTSLVAGVRDSVANTNSIARETRLQNDNLKLQLAAENKEKLRLQEIINSPVISVASAEAMDKKTNPSFEFDTLRNRYIFSVGFINSGKGKAYDLSNKFIAVSVTKGQQLAITRNVHGSYTNVMKILDENGGGTVSLLFNDDDTAIAQRGCYIAVRVDYKNAFNSTLPPMKMVYYVDRTLVGQKARWVKDFEYSLVNKFLVHHKAW